MLLLLLLYLGPRSLRSYLDLDPAARDHCWPLLLRLVGEKLALSSRFLGCLAPGRCRLVLLVDADRVLLHEDGPCSVRPLLADAAALGGAELAFLHEDLDLAAYGRCWLAAAAPLKVAVPARRRGACHGFAVLCHGYVQLLRLR